MAQQQCPYQSNFQQQQPVEACMQRDVDYCEFNDEDEMVTTERELAEDAQWKKIQQNTFTRWANEHLKTVQKHIGNLETDLSDGLRLITLIEVLAGKRLPKHNKKPSFRSQKLENVSVALKFLQDDEGIRIVNIDSSHIVDCKLKLILGLIWTLILHYSISLPMWEGEDDMNNGGTEPTPKQRLMNWIQTKLPDLPIHNFTTDWNDGKAVGALVDAVAPGLCPDWPDWNPKDSVENASEAMGLADDWLGIPQLIKPEEIVNPNVDEQSMMTYLSQFPNAKLKTGAPLRPRTSPNKLPPPRVRVYGPGIEPTGPVVGAPANFTVETFSAGKGQVDVVVENPKGQKEPVEVRFNNDRNLTYSVAYTPKIEGNHKISVKFAGREVPKSPYTVKVEGHAGDPTKVTASGPGLQPDGVCINRPTYFDISTKNAGKGVPEVIILDPSGNKNSIPVTVRQTNQDLWRCEYISPTVGLHSVNIFFAGQPIPKSPYGVRVSPVSDARKVRASGRGLQPAGVRVKDDADFRIYTEGAGEGVPDVQIIGPGGVKESCKITKIDGTTYYAVYHPMKEGRYIVMITFAGQEIYKSPFEVNVGPYKETLIRAYGPGLAGGVVGYPALFTVETNGETGALGFSIQGPSQARIDCQDNGDGSADVRYYPTAPGEYAVHILCDSEDIPKSPHIAQILPNTDYHPEKVEVYGPGIEPSGVQKDVPAKFTIDARKAGSAPLDVRVADANCKPVEVKLTEKPDGTVDAVYVPHAGNRHTVQVNYGGVATKNSPFRVYVGEPVDASKVHCFGPGVEDGVKANTPTHFNIDARDAGDGDLDVHLVNEETRQEIPVKLTDNGDRTYTVDYETPQSGMHTVTLHYGGLRVPTTPIKFKVHPNVDVSKIRVDGLEPTAPVNSLQQFRVITQDAGKAEFAISITSPSGSKVKAHVIPTHEGYLVNFTPTQLGEYLLGISFGGEPISHRPFRLTCLTGSDPLKVKASGPGLHRGIVNRPAEFMIDTRGAGQGGLGVTVEGPCEAAINCRDNGDGTCSVAYLPTEIGDYGINITFNDQHIPGSPFQAIIVPEVDMNKIKVSGSGIQLHGVFVDSPTDFLVDTRGIPKTADDGIVTCTITNPSGAQTENLVTPLLDGTYKVSYTPFEEGRHTIDIFYDNVPVPGSPFIVNVRRGCDAKKCIAYGPGLEQGFLNKSNVFTVETKGAGTGGLSLAIEGPSEAKMTCKDNRDGSCSVEYIPTEPGEYDVAIKFADQHISGSPFKVQVVPDVDEKLVRAYGPGLEPSNCRSGVPTKFTIDASKVGPAPVAVNITSDQKPLPRRPEVKNNDDGTFEVSYIPPNEGANLKAQITYNGKDIPNSPFPVKVRPTVEPERVKLSGPSIDENRVPASIPTTIKIDTKEAGYGDLDVQVLGPDGYPRKVKITDNGDGTYGATFVPDDCGRYKIDVKYGGKEVTKAPISTQAYAIGNAEKCKITEGVEKTICSGESYCITVNTENAGRGAVTCRIRSTSGSDLDINIVDNGDGTFNIYYTVNDADDYTINIKFGGQPIPGGFYTFTAEEVSKSEKTSVSHSQTESVKKTSTRSKQTFRPLNFDNIPLPSTGGHVTAEIKMPSGTTDKPVIEDNHDGTVSIRYDPREEGLHELAVKFNGEHVQGSPYKIHVDSISSGYVTAYGPGLTHGVSGEPSNFTISTKGAGAGGLSLAVEGPSKAEISCHDNKDGTVSVSYLPTAPGEYKISVRFGDKHIKGSPFNAKITGEGRKRNQISVGSCSEVSLPGKISDADIRSLNASIQAPSGLEEPCFLKRLPTGNIGISFTPREIGEHVVSVKKMGNHITNSPFKINVCEREVGDARKVLVSGNALKEGKTHVQNTFNVDTRNAGFGGLSLSIEGPSKAEIQCNDNTDGTLNISYKPTEPGYYIVNLKFADHHVNGSPFTVKVTGEGTNRQREKIQRQREAVPITEVGSQCKLTFKMPGITSFDLSATVTSPGGVTEDAVINEVQDGLYAVHFVPKELGVHTVSVRYKDIHIPGSPFQFTVGPYRDHGAHLVKAGGAGLERGEQGELNEFNVWTREAGSGQLAISVEGPSKAEINFTDRKDGSCDVSYRVSEPGEYRIGLKFNDEHVPDSPFKVYISPAVGDAHLLEVAQFPEGCIQADKPSQFIVRRNGAKGNLDAKIIGPSGHEDDCFVQIIDLEEYSVRFMPRENGIHKIHAKFNGVHIPGSPFSVKVGKDTADPAAVHAAGAGLTDVKTGVKTDFIIDTVNAGAGTLAVNIDGPSKVSMDCTEVEEGYKVRYTPLAPGDYYISIKYNNNHIVGSPFKVNSKGDAKVADIGGQESSSVVVETTAKVGKGLNGSKGGPVLPHFKSNASKVTSKGQGLKKAFLGKQNQFTVSAQDAGTNILFVGVHGPKGPCEEVFIKHQGRNQYAVSYVVRERGDYIVIVKWGDDHIPGSPFKVEV
ncbi:filamin-A isoform X1 [Tribolium castaneum]|uniref:filamin-A isoform X1 n=2 Tax=Tribolium castaneum TaxID=7070 RepID=UPI00077DD0A7|nr:PREDICTED: filamin-A isoform X1 [Tribolium castaneum]|eukprot:XP_015833310.1 PREDICTED: filamin-A isoform X1 [Tribolium castaneum]